MKKTILMLVFISLASSAHSAGFPLEKFKAKNISVNAAAVPAPAAPSAAKEVTQVPQDVVNKFNQVKNALWRLESDTTWLRSDINRLENTARRIAMTNSSDPFFQNDLQRMSFDMSRYAGDAQRIGYDLKGLLNLGLKDAALNGLARDIESDARTLLNRAQFDIENSAQQLEWAVRSAKPELVGYNAQWQAMDISRYGRDFTWKVRDLSYDAQTLVSQTQP